MKGFYYLLLIVLMSSGIKNTYAQDSTECICCKQTYFIIDSAFSCLKKSNKLLLLVVVNSSSELYQYPGWGILKDQEAIEIAKEKYILLTITMGQIQLSEKFNSVEILQVLTKKGANAFFVVTNEVLFPFNYWESGEERDMVINYLKIGNNPP